jgi:hypothetical protein
MAQQTRTWAEVVGLTQARAGAAFSSGTELTNIGFLLNSAARTIYDESRYWERYLVLEPRTAARGYIATTEDSYNVYGAGTAEANGLYVRNGNSVDGNPAYTLFDTDGTTALYNIWSSLNAAWQITDGVVNSPTNSLYGVSSTSTTPPLDGWGRPTQFFTGASPAPIVQALSEIGEAIGYWGAAKWSGNDPLTLTAYPDQNGIRVASNVTGTVYVAFKKAWTDTYGNGESGTLATVPSEWAEFMAYDAARSYRASQSGEDGFNPIALRDVNNALERALMKVSRSGAIAALTNQLKTQYSVDESV